MTRLALPLLALAVAATPAQAHFLWLLPPEPGAAKPVVRAVFSDTPKPDDNRELLKKIAGTEFFTRTADGQTTTLKPGEGKDALELPLAGNEPQWIVGVCHYGVVQRGESPPFLLNYYAVTFTGTPDLRLLRGTEKLPFQFVVYPGRSGTAVRVQWQGKPLGGAQIVFFPYGQDKGIAVKTEADGTFTVPEFKADGFGMRIQYIEAKEGEADGKKYKEIRHYFTMTDETVKRQKKDAEKVKPALKEDLAATKLLAEARAARAEWSNFPGFKANVEVNLDGQVTKGTVTVSNTGEVTLKLKDEAAAQWAKRQLASLVGHRLSDGGGTATPCAFLDDNDHHPLGRAVQVLNDEFHSSYRIRDKQVIVVNRTGKEMRFTITVMENRLNKEKKFLPVSYVVNYWDPKTEALRSSDTFHVIWKRVGDFDLPAKLDLVTATAGKQEARSLKLSKHQLLSK